MSESDQNTDPLDREAVAALAYRLWQQRGCPEGSGEEDWWQAEAQLRAAAQRQAEATGQAVTGVKPHAAPSASARGAPRATRAATAAAPRKTRVTRARPARPDA